MSVPNTETTLAMRRRFGAWLKEARETAGLTQRDMAERLDYAYPTTISVIERGVSPMPAAEIKEWAEVLRVDLQTLADWYLYFQNPFVYAALYGHDPHELEQLPKPQSTVLRREDAYPATTGPQDKH